MMTIEGTLPDGIVREDGAIIRDFELRPQLVRDSLELLEGDEADKAMASDMYYGIAIKARRLRIGGSQVTTQEFMNMTQEDFNEINEADKRLTEKRRTFRDAAGAAPEADHRPA